MDIELADGMCFTIFSETQIKCPIIFTTAYDQYAMKAFSLISIDYLLKPVTIQALSAALKKYRQILSFSSATLTIESLDTWLKQAGKNYKQRFLVKVGTRMFFIDNRSIAYFFAKNKNVFLVDNEGMRYLIDYSLDDLQQMMSPNLFFRLNRKFICNLAAIREIKLYVNSRLKIIVQAGQQKDEIIVSRERVHAFKEWAEVDFVNPYNP